MFLSRFSHQSDVPAFMFRLHIADFPYETGPFPVKAGGSFHLYSQNPVLKMGQSLDYPTTKRQVIQAFELDRLQ
jgi:hypothetical protein